MKNIEEKLSIRYERPRWWELMFSRYKGGRLIVGPGEYYHDIGGHDWELILNEDLFSKFKYHMEPVAKKLKEEGNFVEYTWSFCRLFVRFISYEHAKDFDKIYYED